MWAGAFAGCSAACASTSLVVSRRHAKVLFLSAAWPLLIRCSRINGAQIWGGIPASFASMRCLRTLALPWNRMNAPLPLPEELPPSLEVLDLSLNSFSSGKGTAECAARVPLSHPFLHPLSDSQMRSRSVFTLALAAPPRQRAESGCENGAIFQTVCFAGSNTACRS